MEEKRKNNVMLMKGVELKERDIERAEEAGKKASTGQLEVLLPKLKRTHELQNEELTERQERIISILKGSKLSAELNSPEVRKHFRNEQGFNSAKNVGGKKFN
jgi:hypothetical protein